MSHGVYSVVLVAVIAMVAAKPHNGLALSTALNKTLCPTVVKYNKDANRIPRIIKTLECEGDPEEMCGASSASAQSQCCRLQRAAGAGLVLRCAQVTDQVVVSSKLSARVYTMSVPVGCSCVAHDPTPATDAS